MRKGCVSFLVPTGNLPSKDWMYAEAPRDGQTGLEYPGARLPLPWSIGHAATGYVPSSPKPGTKLQRPSLVPIVGSPQDMSQHLRST